VPVPPDLDAASLLQDVAGRVARATDERPRSSLGMAAQFFPTTNASRFDRSLRSVYDGRHHLIVASDGHEELYDVAADPLELRNLIADEDAAGVVERLRPLLEP